MKEIKLLLLCLLPLSAAAQYPVDYFRNPLDLPLLLAGNFGECRPGHFHSGIDIKTEGKENQAVYAAADGYISRVKMEPGGFGHAIYITHPNGYTTLYAHLNDFFAPLQERVHRKQYENRNWELDLSFAPEEFPVQQGKLIARSGNTGGSTAPHLHFEIRDTKTEHPLNPLLFGLRIADNIAPIAYKLALYDRSRSVYEQEPQLLPLVKKGDSYRPAKDTLAVKSAQTGIGLFVHDFMNGSENTLAVYQVSWYLDDVLQGKMVLDNIGYEETRYLNACADYKLKQQSGDWYNSLFLLKGNRLDHVYHELNNDKGNLVLPDLVPHRLKILLEDAAGNSSVVTAVLLRKDTAAAAVRCENPFTATAAANFTHPNVRFRPGPAALYDDICFRFRKTPDSESFVGRLQLHDARVPLHEYTELELKPDKPVPFAWTGKMVMAVQDGKTISGKAAVLRDGWYRASVRSLGTYMLLADTTAPRILSLQKKGSSGKGRKELRFRITDNLTRVKQLEGMLDGRWICMEQHGSDWFYRFDEYCPAGKHNLVLTATDENGNESRMVYPFLRNVE